MRDMTFAETELVSGGDSMTYEWGKMVGEAARTAWDAMKDYAASDNSSTDVIA